MIARLIFPLALPDMYTYRVPDQFVKLIQPGIRVEVSLRDKLYSAIVYEIIPDPETDGLGMKEIISLIDEKPIVRELHLQMWKWISKYYMCSIGEVMAMALPGGLKLESETRLQPGEVDYQEADLNDDEFLIAEAVSLRKEINIQEIRLILNRKTIYPVIRSLLSKDMVSVSEELQEKFAPKKMRIVSISNHISDSEEARIEALDSLKKAKVQEETFLQLLDFLPHGTNLPVSEIYRLTGSNGQILKALQKKGFITIEEVEDSRITAYEKTEDKLPALSSEQIIALDAIREAHAENKTAIIHGVTGSGKTRLYIEEITQCLNSGRQALFLMPEIALTTQMVQRVKSIFGKDLMVYHSKMNGHERVEIWQAVMEGRGMVLGARSAIFLPFKDLGLIIVDEEHDPSYKQFNPAPRYNARDCAVAFASMYQGHVIMGSATPSLESFENAVSGKYKIVTLKERYGNVQMPAIRIVDMAYEQKANRVKSLFSLALLDAMSQNLENQKQTILFQNRRGYAPIIQCTSCGHTEMCPNCDVHLTLHRYFDELRCHYCNYRKKSPLTCPECGGKELKEIGAGTERIEQELKMHFPSARIARLDYDTAKTKASFERLIQKFSDREIDILIGTQMITKGFDFDHVTLVGIVNADAMLMFPDFRANERAFQMLTQVSGRAGRRSEQGQVLIQAYRSDHPILYDVRDHHFNRMYVRESSERHRFGYPPFFRLLTIELRHKDAAYLDQVSRILAELLSKKLGKRVLGPAIPGISRIKNLYIRTITIKFEKEARMMHFVKDLVIQTKKDWINKEQIKNVRVVIDIDPY